MLDSIVDPLVVPDLVTLVWSPHGHDDAVDALLQLAQVVLIDSVNEPDPRGGARPRAALTERAYVVDLAWLRSHAVARARRRDLRPAAVAPRARRDQRRHRAPPPGLGRARAAAVRLARVAARLGAGLADRRTATAARHAPTARAADVEMRARARRDACRVPGLAGHRRSRPLRACDLARPRPRRPAGQAPHARRQGVVSWTVLGASRGEAGILGEGIRQALLRDPTYAPALAAAEAMLR